MSLPNILFLMSDQHRPDHAGFMPGSKFATPHIDRIAEGTAFTSCQTVNPVCMPARSALATGKHSRQVGALNMSGDLSLQHPTFMRALQAAGYHTSGIGKFHYLQTEPWSTPRGKGLDLIALESQVRGYGYDYVWETSGKQASVRNYNHYCRYLEERGLLEKYRDYAAGAGVNKTVPDEELEKDGRPWPLPEEHHIDIVTADKIIEQLLFRPKERPFYVFGSFCSPHKPFDPPERYLSAIPYDETEDFIPGEKGDLPLKLKKSLWRLRRAYRATVRLLDDQIARILRVLEEQKLMENTIIFFTSDHGEMMGDHGRIQKSAPWRESLTVPTAIRHPAHLDRRVCSTPVEIIDLSATILDAAGLDPQSALSKSWPAFHDRVPCRSLMPVLRGEANGVRDYSFSEYSSRDEVWQCVQSERYKFIRYDTKDVDRPREAFYDLAADPTEQNNLIAQPQNAAAVDWHRQREQWTRGSLLPAQTTWAPLPG